MTGTPPLKNNIEKWCRVFLMQLGWEIMRGIFFIVVVIGVMAIGTGAVMEYFAPDDLERCYDNEDVERCVQRATDMYYNSILIKNLGIAVALFGIGSLSLLPPQIPPQYPPQYPPQ